MNKEKIKQLDMKITENQKQFIDYQNYIKERMCQVFGIPSYLIEGYKETRWQKIKRNMKKYSRLFICWLGFHRWKPREDFIAPMTPLNNRYCKYCDRGYRNND